MAEAHVARRTASTASVASDPGTLADLASRAAAGERDALEALCRALQDPIHRLALRFFSSPDDAEDCTQEILIQVITHLGAFEGRSALMTWVYRIASRHLLRTKRRRVEESVRGAEAFAAWLDANVAEEPYAAASEAEYRMLCEEVRIGCTYGMLLCLSRELRLAYILGDLLDLTDREGAEALEITPAAFRQRLVRARATVRPIIAGRCGLVEPAGTCRCDRQVASSMRHGLIPPTGPVFTTLPCTRPGVSPVDAARFERAAAQLDVAERFAAVFRNDPAFAAPSRVMTALVTSCPDLLA